MTLHGSHRRNGEVTLYDLAADPGEKVNLAEKCPEVPKTYAHGDDKGD